MEQYIFTDIAIHLVKSTEERFTVLLQKLIQHRGSVNLNCLAKEVNQRVVQVMKIILDAHYGGGLRELKNSHFNGGVFFLLNCILDKSLDERGEKPDLSNVDFLLDVWSAWLFVCGEQKIPYLDVCGKFDWRLFTQANENSLIASHYYQNLDNLEVYLQDSINLLGFMEKHIKDITELRDSGCKRPSHGPGYAIPRSFPLHIRQAILKLQKEGGSDETIAQLIIEGQKAAARRKERIDSRAIDKKPLSERTAMIYEKLRSLEPHLAMTLPKIQRWYEEKTGKNLDEGTWKKIRKELLPYGLKNRPRAGYYVRCDDK